MIGKKNIGSSVRQRLLNLSRAEKTAFNRVLDRYIRERFLARLAISDMRERLILKGATLFIAWEEHPYRATYDLDLLGITESKSVQTEIERMITIVAGIEIPEDGVRFELESIQIRSIREQNRYGGVRIRLAAELDTMRTLLQIDVGIGDAVSPPAVQLDFPSLLTQKPIRLCAYQPETVIAEKFQTMVDLGMINSRMKDYYDIWFLADTVEIEGAVLCGAIKSTFDRRRTAVPEDTPSGLSEKFAVDEQKTRQWSTFLDRTDAPVTVPLDQVVEVLRVFLMAPSIAVARQQTFVSRWYPLSGWREASS